MPRLLSTSGLPDHIFELAVSSSSDSPIPGFDPCPRASLLAEAEASRSHHLCVLCSCSLARLCGALVRLWPPRACPRPRTACAPHICLRPASSKLRPTHHFSRTPARLCCCLSIVARARARLGSLTPACCRVRCCSALRLRCYLPLLTALLLLPLAATASCCSACVVAATGTFSYCSAS